MIEGSIIVAICAIITAAGVVLAAFLRYERRQTRIEITAADALQTAAESDQSYKHIEERLIEIEREIRTTSDATQRNFGETVHAMQQKIHEIETWSRDEFVRKQSFEQGIDRVEKTLAVRDERLEHRLERIEQKLDEVTSIQKQ